MDLCHEKKDACAFHQGYGFFYFEMVDLRSVISNKRKNSRTRTLILVAHQLRQEGGSLMGKKEDAKLISEKAKDYFTQGFN